MDAREIRIKGIVQGVGFRPFVYRLARRFDIKGKVLNDTEGVLIFAEAELARIDSFIRAIRDEAPRPAAINEILSHSVEPTGASDFTIVPSEHAEGEVTSMSPDIATCENCLAELFDIDDRRYGYPFINCTHCGPRYSIIRGLPYDRPQTSMAIFEMCDDCRTEYEEVLDRRFHAQPNACELCGPRYSLLDGAGEPVKCSDPIFEACNMLSDGKVVAVKGIGGFHLMADATNPATVEILRDRKRRPSKPFALMVRDIGVAKMLCEVSDAEADELGSPAAPIVLLKLRKNPAFELPSSIAPGLDQLGLFLPYAPVHYLLFAATGLPCLIATSGNRRDEPIACDNDEVVRDLQGIADAFLVHNRDIVGRTDDSVGFIFEDNLILVRRSRGYVPKSSELPLSGPPVLATGADLKGCFALTRRKDAFLSPYLGDLTGEKSVELFEEVLERYLSWLKVKPEALVCDLHPDYMSTVLAEKYSNQWGVPLYRIQHHFAHALSVMAEFNLPDEPCLAVALDGHGYGGDGTIWGGEFLLTRYDEFERLGHIFQVPQLGGDKAAIDTRRMALSWLYAAFGEDALQRVPKLFENLGGEADLLLDIARRNLPPTTSSTGRLFDAVACLAGICCENTFEGECPQKLMAAVDFSEKNAYDFAITSNILDPRPVITQIIADIESGVSANIIAAKFHRGLAHGIVEMAAKLCDEHSLTGILLTGGVFQNRVLLELVVNGLRKRKLKPHWNRSIPPGDAGVALGQALFGINKLRADDRDNS